MENPEVRRGADAGVQRGCLAGLLNDGYVAMNQNGRMGEMCPHPPFESPGFQGQVPE